MTTNQAENTRENQAVLDESVIEYPIELLSKDGLFEKLYDNKTGEWRIPIKEKIGEHAFFKGFSLFNSEELVGCDLAVFEGWVKEKDFLLAYDSLEQKPEEIIGALYLNLTNNFGNLPYFWELGYVNVRGDRTGQGVCTNLFKKLNDILIPSDVLVGTALTKLGIKHRLYDKLDEIITACPFFHNDVDYGKYCIREGIVPRRGK